MSLTDANALAIERVNFNVCMAIATMSYKFDLCHRQTTSLRKKYCMEKFTAPLVVTWGILQTTVSALRSQIGTMSSQI
jgi:hypothetical protein